MKENRSTWIAHATRLRSTLLVFTAIVLFLAGLLLLFAPSVARDHQSRSSAISFHPCEEG